MSLASVTRIRRGEEMDPREAEAFLGLPKGAFDHIPIYARKPALEAIAKVRILEQERTFRPGLY